MQQGSQSRSSPALQEGVERLRNGAFGEIYMARGLCYKWRDTIGKTPVSPVPPGVDYDLWLGPAPKREFTKNRFHYNWHWFWDTGNGDLGNQGIHEVDIARWGLGVTHPTKVSAIGGKFMFDDDQETPNTISASYEFDVDGKKKMMTFEVRHWISPHEAGINGEKPGNTIGNQFYGSKGYLVIDNYNKYYSFLGRDSAAGTDGDRARHALAELHRRGPRRKARGAQRRNRGRRPVLQTWCTSPTSAIALAARFIGTPKKMGVQPMDDEANKMLDPCVPHAVRGAKSV